MDDLMNPAQRRAAHRAWLAGLGLSAEDWQRLRLLASEVTDRGSPPALRDLSVPLCVAALPAAPKYRSGRLLGVITQPDGRKVALVCWPMGEHERTVHWTAARAARGQPGSATSRPQ